MTFYETININVKIGVIPTSYAILSTLILSGQKKYA